MSRLAAQGVELQIVHTNGGPDNVARLEAAGSIIDVAFVNGGLTDAVRSPQLESLGTIGYDPIWIVHRKALGELDGIPKLRGLTIGIGRDGSGTAGIGRRVLEASGIRPGTSRLVAVNGGDASAVRELVASRLDAAILTAPAEDPEVRAAFDEESLRVMNVADADGLARNLPFLHALHVPRSTVDPARQRPDRDLL